MNILRISVLSLLLVAMTSLAEESVKDPKVEELGQLLFEAISNKNTFKQKKLGNYKALNEKFKSDKCPGYKYRFYLIEHDSESTLYIVGSANRSKAYIIGRHFKVNLVNNKAVMETFSASTNGCLNLGVPPKNAAAMMASHLQAYPSEFHVAQNLEKKVDLYIIAEGATWIIHEGKIGPKDF